MARAALKLVESHGFSREELELPIRSEEGVVHSLHSLCSLPGDLSPEIAEYCINRFSGPDSLILDPFCGSGTVPLQASLLGRKSIASDINPLAIDYTKAKLAPADIAEVALALHLKSFTRPVALDNYEEYFSPFYDVNTYRELSNLQTYLSSSNDRVSNFISAATGSLLHGHGASCFSSYSFSTVSLSPAEQRELNARRGQYPDYRAVQSRILKKTAGVMRDGFPSRLRNQGAFRSVFQADARDLSSISNNSIDLVLSDPLMPGSKNYLDNIWLKLWFSQVSRKNLEASITIPENLDDWLDFMNETSFEMARVVKPGGRFICVLSELEINGVLVHDKFIESIEESLGRYWSTEVHIKTKSPSPLIAGTESRSKNDSLGKHLLVFRRR
ncbi:MAG: DNA methyltransferase [Bdellovibrionota bacterium]